MKKPCQEILSIVLPESVTEERRRSKVHDTVMSLDLKTDLKEAIIWHERHCTTCYSPKTPSNLRKKHVDGHFAMASVQHAMELAYLFSAENVFFLSQGDKAGVPLGLPVSKIEQLF